MPELKPLHPDAIPKALQKAERYRLLAEPEEAESICLDILAVEPGNPDARTMLLLALTDQLRTDGCLECYVRARDLVAQFPEGYERHYYTGIILERRASAQLERSGPGVKRNAYNWLQQAMASYEKAEAVRPPQNDDAVLRWNTCVRMIQKHGLKPAEADSDEPSLLE
jgi:tetratricopeptide (TPR) repeat protein